MPRGVPNVLITRNNKVKKISVSLLPSPETAVQLYHQNGGRISDPIGSLEKTHYVVTLRRNNYSAGLSVNTTLDLSQYVILCAVDTHLFQEALLFYVDISYRLANS